MAFDWSNWVSDSITTPKVRLTLPPAYFFKFPPSNNPQTLPPPSDHPTLAHPFTIPVDIYNAALSPNVPILAALVYATVITYLNSVNARRKYKPWAFSKTRFFKILVITHNIILAVYSAWTFVGMINAFKTSIYPPWEEHGLAGTVDSLCKVHGPRDIGSAAVFGETSSAWSVANRLVHLGADGLTPESTDVGRLWNQGLAFYGWLFYLSKFYEVIDTLIIIAKGKKSSLLQTYHHAGAMLCMWAGMRYMSGPIWMFVLVNSFIHTIMYTFYLCSAIGVRVPVWFKRTLTTLQITQFVIGASYAFAHLFIKYQSPISVPYIYHLGNVASSAAVEASSVASSVYSTASAMATDDWPALLKKFALRAAGREGLAQNVYDHSGHTFGVDAVKAAKDWVTREETRYRDELQWTNCLDTSGQAFAVMLNVVYLLPLTWLFANFFIQSYLQRVERRRSSTASQKAQAARESVSDAAKRSGRRLSQAFEDSQAGVEDTGDEAVIIDTKELKAKINKATSKIDKEVRNAVSSAREAVDDGFTTVQKKSSQYSSRAETKVEEGASSLKRESSDIASKVDEQTSPTKAKAKQGMASTLDDLKAQADSLKAKAQGLYEADAGYVKDGFERIETAISSLISGWDADQSASGKVNENHESSTEGLSKATDGAAEKDGKADSSSSTKLSKNNQSSNEYSSTPQGQTSATKESTSKVSETSQKQENTSSSAPQNTDQGQKETEQAATIKPKEQETEELSSKEKVQQQGFRPKVEAEASTGDAKKDDSPAEQSSTQNTNRKTTTPSKKSRKKAGLKQDPSLEGGNGEDVANEEIVSQRNAGQGLLNTATDSAREAASNVVTKIQDTVEDPPAIVKQTADQARKTASEATKKIQNTIENPPVIVKDAADQVQSKLGEAQAAFSRVSSTTTSKSSKKSTTASSSTHKRSGSKDTVEGRDYEDQKESWIHIPQTSEAEAEKSKQSAEQGTTATRNKNTTSAQPKDGKSTDSTGSTSQSEKQTDSLTKVSTPIVRPSSPEWFEKLTSGIDSPTKARMEAEKRAEDKIIDESEAVRTEPIAQGTSSKESTSVNTKGTNKESGSMSKEEQDKILDESEPVRDEIKETGSSTKKSEVGA